MRLRILLAVVLSSAAGWAQTAAPTAANKPPNRPPSRPPIHDPSTILRDGDLFYVFASGRGVPIFSSADLHTWKYRGSVFTTMPAKAVKLVPGHNGVDGWAPDIVKVGNTFYLYYAVARFGSTAAAIGLATNTTLDPDDAAYHWVDRGVVVSSNGKEMVYAIDPGVTRAPDGKLWLSYGSFRGDIELVQLNTKTGLQLKPSSLPHGLASDSEASDIIVHDGWFYLFVNHGVCCAGINSTYHINVGRSRRIAGPYVDREGKSMLDGPGEPFLASEGEHIGPGHFGLLLDGQRELFGIHYEADTGSQGKPVLAVRALEWTDDGWPKAGPAVDAHPAEPPTPIDRVNPSR